MNVLFLTCWYPNKYSPYEGVFVKEHAHAIKQNSTTAIVILAANAVKSPYILYFENLCYIDGAGIETHHFTIKSRFYKAINAALPLFYPFIKTYYNKRIAPSFRPDLVHSHVIFPAGVIGYWLSKSLKCPHIITEHWSKVDKFFRVNIFSWWGKKAYNTASNITTVSAYLKTSISKHLNNPEKVSVVSNVVNTDVFSYKPKKNAEKICFLAVAFWKSPKLPMLIYKALAKAQSEHSQTFHLHIVGEGPLLEEVKTLTNKNPNSIRVSYHGIKSKEEIATLLEESNYFIHASETETFSVVTAEALSTGTPAIVSNVGGLKELVNISNGCLCNNSIADFYEGVRFALNQKYNHAGIAEQMQRKVSAAAVSKQFIDLYAAAVGSINSH